MHTPTENWPSLGQPVLVAVDGGNESLEAVAWGVAEAAARQTSLLLLHVYHWPYFWVPLSEVYPVIDTCGVLDDARNVFETATEQAHQVAPGVMVNTLLRTGDPARLISDEGKHACLVVLGRREDSNPTRPRRRSVTRHVIARSHCPVTLVGSNRLPLPGPAAGRVVTALPSGHDARSATPVLDAAFTAAQRRGIGVTVLARRSAHPGLVDSPGAEAPTTSANVQTYARAFDEIDVRQIYDSQEEPLLRRESPSAALLVLTTPGHRFRRTPSSSTLGRLLAITSAPITFVRADPRQCAHDTRGTGLATDAA